MKINSFYTVTVIVVIFLSVFVGVILISDAVLLKDNFTDETAKLNEPSLKTHFSTTTTQDTISNAKGIDVSRYQGAINWDSLNPKVSFAICKATEGKTLMDTEFTHNWNQIRQSGRIRGAYHFYITSDDPTAQANFFWNTLSKDYTDMDLPLVLDVESASIRGTISKSKLQKDVLAFLKEIRKLSGKTPLLYSNTDFANEYLAIEDLSYYPLWVAEYTPNEAPNVPTAWKKNGWTFWQRSDTYDLNDIHGDVDFDRFNGTQNDLKLFIANDGGIEN